MSNVVRRATFVLDFTTGKSDVKAPDLSSVTTAQKAILEQQTKIKEAVDKEIESRLVLKRVQEEGVVAAQASFRGLAEGAQNAAEGVLLLARSMVLFGATEDDISKVLVQLAKLQGVIDLMRGLRQAALGVKIIFTALTTVMNPLNAVLLLVFGAISGGVLAYKSLTGSVETATEALKRHREELEKQETEDSTGSQAIEMTGKQKRQEKAFADRLRLEAPGAGSASIDAITKARRIHLAVEAFNAFKQVPGVSGQQLEAAQGGVLGVVADAVAAQQSALNPFRSRIAAASGRLDAAHAADAATDPYGASTSPGEAKAEAELFRARDAYTKAIEFFTLGTIQLGDAIKHLVEQAQAAENGAISSP